MQIKGFQKTTFIDYPNKVASLVFTGGCNFRCPFCHNGGLVVNPNQYPTTLPETVFQHLQKRKGIIDGLVITGGEPTLMPGLKAFIQSVKALGVSVKLDTNGTNPGVLKDLIHEGLVDYIAMDIKHVFEKYASAIGPSKVDMDPIKDSIQIIIASGVDHEFRTTVIKGMHTEEDIALMAGQVSGANNYILQQYVKTEGEIMPNTFKSFTIDELQDIIDGIGSNHKIKSFKVRGKY
tara:strand:+ start:162 stop:866 length:705 start_codon:yes stop_codon:yes gene_type:complete